MPDTTLSTAAAIGRYLEDLAIGHAPATVQTYRASLRRFLAFVAPTSEGRPLPVDALTEDHVMDYARQCAKPAAGLSPVSQATYSTAVLTFYHWLVRERYRPDLDLRPLDDRLQSLRGRKRKRLVKVPTDATIDAVVRLAQQRVPEADAATIDCRDLAIVECLRGSGLRVSELVGLRRRDLIPQDHAARIIGKGDKERLAYFTPAAWTAMDAYLALRPGPAQAGDWGRAGVSSPRSGGGRCGETAVYQEHPRHRPADRG